MNDDIRSEILRLSDDASLLFSVGRIHEASVSWHGVIRRLLPLVTSDLKENDLLSTTTATTRPAVPVTLQGTFVVVPVASAIEGTLPSSSSSSKLTSQDRTFALYASAIHYSYVPPQWGVRGLYDDDDADYHHIMALAATAVYNLGLCHHLQSILDESRATEHCQKALRAYKASRRILMEGSGLCCVVVPPNIMAEDFRPDNVQHHLLGVSLLQLAIVNNVGHIHDLLHNRHEAHHQLVALHSLVASLLHHHCVPCYGYNDDGAGHRGGRPFVLNDDSTATAPFVPFLLTAALYHPVHYTRSLPPAPCA